MARIQTAGSQALRRSSCPATVTARTLDMLEEAVRQAESAEATAATVRALTGIIKTFATVNATRAFDIANTLVKTVKQVRDKTAFAVDDARLVRSFSSQGMSTLNTSNEENFDLGQTFVLLARSDFERTLGLAQTIEEKRFKWQTILAIAEANLPKA